jgi:hypothetical protein
MVFQESNPPLRSGPYLQCVLVWGNTFSFSTTTLPKSVSSSNPPCLATSTFMWMLHLHLIYPTWIKWHPRPITQLSRVTNNSAARLLIIWARLKHLWGSESHHMSLARCSIRRTDRAKAWAILFRVRSKILKSLNSNIIFNLGCLQGITILLKTVKSITMATQFLV